MSKSVVLISLYALTLVHGIIYQTFMRRHRSWRERPRYETSTVTRLFRPALFVIYLVGLADFPVAVYVQNIMPTAATFAIGMALGGVALVLLAWSLASLGENFSDCTDGRLPVAYVKHGPYRFLSHPIYVSNILLLSACTMVLFNVVLVAVTVFTALFYVRSARDETRALRARFGP